MTLLNFVFLQAAQALINKVYRADAPVLTMR